MRTIDFGADDHNGVIGLPILPGSCCDKGHRMPTKLYDPESLSFKIELKFHHRNGHVSDSLSSECCASFVVGRSINATSHVLRGVLNFLVVFSPCRCFSGRIFAFQMRSRVFSIGWKCERIVKSVLKDEFLGVLTHNVLDGLRIRLLLTHDRNRFQMTARSLAEELRRYVLLTLRSRSWPATR
jgi:hypothetical protein